MLAILYSSLQWTDLWIKSIVCLCLQDPFVAVQSHNVTGTASENSGQQATQDIGFALYISIWITLCAVLHESFSGCNTFGNQLDRRKVQRILFVANNRFLGTFGTNARKWNCEMHQKPCASWNRIIERCVRYMVSWLTALLLARWVFFLFVSLWWIS